MKNQKLILFIIFITIFFSSFALTWDEPWKDEVIKEADYFIYAKVKSYNKESVTLKIIKTLGGEELSGKIEITDFYLLNICSRTGNQKAGFNFRDIENCYFFVKKDTLGKYCIATPTTGFDYVKNKKVFATYRHSYHQAIVPVDIYERTMTSIFNHYHNQSYDEGYIKEFVNKYLSLQPAGFDEDEINTFFAQHVALECIYHLRLSGYYSKIMPFLNDTMNVHNQISGARALISCNTEECKKELLAVIENTMRSPFVQVICVWTISEFKPSGLKEKLIQIFEIASSDDNGFGGDIMDPRICTQFPSVKEAIEMLVSKL